MTSFSKTVDTFFMDIWEAVIKTPSLKSRTVSTTRHQDMYLSGYAGVSKVSRTYAAVSSTWSLNLRTVSLVVYSNQYGFSQCEQVIMTPQLRHISRVLLEFKSNVVQVWNTGGRSDIEYQSFISRPFPYRFRVYRVRDLALETFILREKMSTSGSSCRDDPSNVSVELSDVSRSGDFSLEKFF